MHNSLGIFSENLDLHKTHIDSISIACRKLNDFVLFTDNINNQYFDNYAIFPSFYMRFFKGMVIFLTIEDYMQYKDSMIGKPMFFLTEQMLQNNNIDISLINKDSIFSVSGG